MDVAHDAVSTAVTKAASAATYGGSAGAVYFGLTANEFAAFGGLAIAMIGLVVNIWYKHLHYKLAKKNKDDERADD